EDGIRDRNVTGVQTCALPISIYILQNILYIVQNLDCFLFLCYSEINYRLKRGIPLRRFRKEFPMNLNRNTLAEQIYDILRSDIQIGRASCRERDESVVYSTVG